MNLTHWALDNRVATLVFLTLLTLAGVSSYRSLPRAEDPGFVIRAAIVTTFFPGASPERVELLVTDRLEEAIEEIPEVDFVTSESRTGASVITVNFFEAIPPAQIPDLFDTLREKVGDAAPDLPAEVIGPEINDDFGDVFGTVVALTGEGFDTVELERVAEATRARLLRLEDVAKVEILGEQEQRIFIEYDEARLSELDLSAAQLGDILRARNILDPGGDVRTDRERFELEVSGSFDSVEALKSTRFRLPDRDEVVTLSDVATVRRGLEDPPRTAARYNGEEAIVLAVSMLEGGKITRLGPRVLDALESMRDQLPIGFDFHLVAYQTTHVEHSVQNFVASLLQGVAIVLGVMLLTLGIRTGVIVSAVVPVTMVGSLLLMSLFDISLNKMSLAALIIALGLLVDSAIVMAESILVSIREGTPPVKAAIASAAELRLPLLVSSLTTAAALLPTYLAESTTGEYTSAIFEVVTIALLLAWVLSLTMTPLLCVLFVRRERAAAANASEDDTRAANGREHGDVATDSPFYRRYRSFLLTLVRHRWVSLAAFVALLAVGLWAFRFVPQLFFPRKEQTTFKVELDFPYGTPFERNAEVTAEVERYMRDQLMAELSADEDEPWKPNAEREFAKGGVVNWATFLGSGAPRFILGYTPVQPRPNYTFMIANSSDYDAQDRLIEEIEAFVRANFPDVVPRVEKLRNGPPLDYPIEIRLSGDDPAWLYAISRGLKEQIAAQTGTINIGDDWDTYTKKVRVEVDDARVRRAGLTQLDVARSLESATRGIRLTTYREGNDLIPVVLRSTAARQDRVDQLFGLQVASQSGGARVPLEQVASLEVDFEPSKILRRDRVRTLTVQADLDPNADRSITPFSVVGAVQPWLEAQGRSWPLGYTVEMGGEVESSGDAQASIGAKQPIALLIILTLLVLQFNALREPIIVLATLPFTMIGVVTGMVITQKPFGFMALLGVIALFGVVINNAVVLLDRVRIEIRSFGRSRAAAVLEASQRRLRPILLTTATTVGGLIPLWLTGGPMFSPMAVAFLFGLVASTLLTLGLVPVLYAILYRVNFDGVEDELAQAGAVPARAATAEEAG
ncbi:MAG: efflux RND transporter permease subunit [Acidobacteriota bacterium]